MKILIISPFLPGPIDSGGKSRLSNLLRITSQKVEIYYLWLDELSKLNSEGQSDFLYCQKEFNKIKFLSIQPKNRTIGKIVRMGTEILGLPFFNFSITKKKIKKIEQSLKPDIVQCEFSQTIRYCPKFQTPSILVVHEIVSQKIRRQIKTMPTTWGKVFNYLKYIVSLKQENRSKKIFDIIEVVSEDDLTQLIKLGVDPKKIRIIKNGVNPNSFLNSLPRSESKNLYFIGWFDNEQNIDALHYFFTELLPLTQEKNINFNMKIIGKKLPDNLLGFIKKFNFEYYPYLTEADLLATISNHILVVPLRFGGGTRLKIIEAMSLGNPVLSTPIGAEGLEYSDRENIIIFRNKEEFTDGLKSLFSNNDLWNKISKKGRKLIEEKYDWEIIAQDQISLYYKMKKL